MGDDVDKMPNTVSRDEHLQCTIQRYLQDSKLKTQNFDLNQTSANLMP